MLLLSITPAVYLTEVIEWQQRANCSDEVKSVFKKTNEEKLLNVFESIIFVVTLC